MQLHLSASSHASLIRTEHQPGGHCDLHMSIPHGSGVPVMVERPVARLTPAERIALARDLLSGVYGTEPLLAILSAHR